MKGSKWIKQKEILYPALEEERMRLSEAKRSKKAKIGVVGIGKGVGATFIATSVAYLLSEDLGPEATACTAYIEMGRSAADEERIYYTAGLDKRFRNKRFTDFFSLYQNQESIGNYLNLHKGIIWAVNMQGLDCEDFPVGDLAGQCVIADSPNMNSLHRYDVILGVIDPLPGKIFAGAYKYGELAERQKSGLRVIWIVNKDNTMVNHGELKRFLGLKEYISIPLIPAQVIYQSQYQCKLPIEILDDQDQKSGFSTLLDSIKGAIAM